MHLKEPEVWRCSLTELIFVDTEEEGVEQPWGPCVSVYDIHGRYIVKFVFILHFFHEIEYTFEFNAQCKKVKFIILSDMIPHSLICVIQEVWVKIPIKSTCVWKLKNVI